MTKPEVSEGTYCLLLCVKPANAAIVMERLLLALTTTEFLRSTVTTAFRLLTGPMNLCES